MSRKSTTLTLMALVTLIALIFVNIILGASLGLYSPWFAWAVFGIGIGVVALVLRFQQQLGVAARWSLLALPFLIAAGGAVIGV
jgi:hypothetical protein